MDQDRPAATISYDPWNQGSPTMWHLEIEPKTLAGLWSEEKPTLYINQNGMGYWLAQPDKIGESQHKTLREAKNAGIAIMLKAETDLGQNLLTDAGLDASAWEFEYEDGARFRLREDPTRFVEIYVEGSGLKHRFGAFSGEDEIGEYTTAAEAATALLDGPAPKI